MIEADPIHNLIEGVFVVSKWLSGKKQKTLFIILSVLLILSLSLNAASAAGKLVDIKAQLNNEINVMLYGKKFEPKETDGSKLIPITYKGRTYLPLRAVAEAAGLEVIWDAKTNTAYLGDKSGEIAKDEISYIRVTPEFAQVQSENFKLQSRTPEYLNRAPDHKFEFGYASDPGYYAGMSIIILTGYEYDKFKAKFWVDEQKDENGEYTAGAPTIEFKDENGIIVKKMDVEYGKLYEVELDIKDVKELDVWVSGSLSIIGEPMIGK